MKVMQSNSLPDAAVVVAVPKAGPDEPPKLKPSQLNHK